MRRVDGESGEGFGRLDIGWDGDVAVVASNR